MQLGRHVSKHDHYVCFPGRDAYRAWGELSSVQSRRHQPEDLQLDLHRRFAVTPGTNDAERRRHCSATVVFDVALPSQHGERQKKIPEQEPAGFLIQQCRTPMSAETDKVIGRDQPTAGISSSRGFRRQANS
jgi:hypothetical protein